MKTHSKQLPPLQKPVLTIRSRNRSLQIIREGVFFIIFIFAIGLGAIFTGSNLLYLVLAMCMSLLVVSGILSELALKKITVKSTLPPTVYAGDFFSICLEITNEKKYFSSYCLRVSPALSGSVPLEGEIDSYFFHLPPERNEKKNLLVKAGKRGSLQIKGFQISTGFPFGFFRKTKFLPIADETIVFPFIQPVQLPFASDASQDEQGIVRHQGDEIVALREYSEGDPLNAVHWKSSAKTGNLRVKDFRASGHQSFTIFLNLHDPQTNRQVPGPVLEKRINEAASLTYNLIRKGNEVSLKSEGQVQIPFGNSELHLERIMRFLACIGLKRQEH
ncbi:hypothetical protein MNBD_NITROSPINAE05-277 [hydrothermal vent metagenome]|uniref:DUF58 domain-containing protein n=1 Tax=hydrothermal vent metagenome TaxID=652676 RepID=A0A3B1CN74_9ZZZZ